MVLAASFTSSLTANYPAGLALRQIPLPIAPSGTLLNRLISHIQGGGLAGYVRFLVILLVRGLGSLGLGFVLGSQRAVFGMALFFQFLTVVELDVFVSVVELFH